MADSDMNAIIQIINLYGLAVDSQSWDLFDRIFSEDVDADFSATAHWHDRASFKADFAAFHVPFDRTQHCMSNHMVLVDGDAAHALTYGSWRLVRKAVDGNPLWDGTGWYDDRLIRTAEGWRITHRVCRIIWWTGNPAVNETMPGLKFDLATTSVRACAANGEIGFLKAIAD